ncbi:hypothetical protein QQ045_015282 [Rhodiola kirilowii]
MEEEFFLFFPLLPPPVMDRSIFAVDLRRKILPNSKTMSDSRDKGLHFHGGGAGVGAYGGYNYNSAGGYPSVGGYGGYPSQAGGYPPVAYPPPSGYLPQAAAYPGHCHSGHGGLGALIGAVARYGAGHMMSHGHGHGGYVAHGGHGYGYGYHHHGKFKHGKFGKHGKFKHGKFGKHGYRKWK